MSSGSFENDIYTLCIYKPYIFNIHMYKQDLASNTF